MNTNKVNNPEISLLDVYTIVLQYKKLVFATTMLSFIVSLIIALLLQNVYTSSTLLIPSTKDDNLSSEISGVAKLVGVNFGGENVSNLKEAIAVLTAKNFLNKFVEKHNYKPIIFSERWDSDTKKWIPQSPNIIKRITNILPIKKNNSTKKIGSPHEPTIWELVGYFQENMVINENALDGTITISFSHHDPEFATELVNRIVTEINSNLQTDYIKRSQNINSYLQEELKTTQLAEMRSVLFNIIGDNFNNIAIAKAHEEYVFKVLDYAIVPEEKSGPKRVLIILLGMITGMVLGIVIAFVLSFRSAAKES